MIKSRSGAGKGGLTQWHQFPLEHCHCQDAFVGTNVIKTTWWDIGPTQLRALKSLKWNQQLGTRRLSNYFCNCICTALQGVPAPAHSTSITNLFLKKRRDHMYLLKGAMKSAYLKILAINGAWDIPACRKHIQEPVSHVLKFKWLGGSSLCDRTLGVLHRLSAYVASYSSVRMQKTRRGMKSSVAVLA